LTINGPGGGRIIIDADAKSAILNINDGDDEKNSIVNISGLRFINGIAGTGSEIDNFENLTVNSCQFLNGNGGDGAAINNRRFLTVDSCLFENNIATEAGGAIYNGEQALIPIIRNSEFRGNLSDPGGAILNSGTIHLITNSTFIDNETAIANISGTIEEISHSTFERNTHPIAGGAIYNPEGIIESIINSTFSDNSSPIGGAILNDNGVINISFSTIANQAPILPDLPPPPVNAENLKNVEMETGGIVTWQNGVTRVRNSIVAFNSEFNCEGPINDFGGNYSNDFSCGFFGDGSSIILGPLTDNGGPTETMALLGGDPVDGATVNCDALNDMGNPSGVPIGIDQRYFPRPSGAKCDSGAYEAGPESNLTITKASDPPGGEGFEFESDGFDSLVGCGFTGDNGHFVLDDGDSIGCRVPVGNYTISENVPAGYEVFIVCFGDNENLIIDNDKGEIVFSVPEIEPSPDVDCLFTNVRIRGGGGGGCTLAPAGANASIPLYLLIPVLIFIRRIMKKQRN
jgi:predicted outer membrane repeat protein